jgi:predicted O-methyltransferase YrrM
VRYELLIDACRRKQPRAILEVGTWRGERALELLRSSPQSIYYGFDLFEDITKAIIAAEFSKARQETMAAVQAKLVGYDARLVKGNTRQTLAEFREPVDFVWIDGGHSVETIRSDWENVRRVATPDAEIYFDDYYTGGPDIGAVGCNLIVQELRHEILPQRDPVKGGGYTQIVRVFP